MPFPATVYRVLIASPGDVTPERDIVEAAIIDWNDEHARDRSVVFVPVRWERASPRGGATGQEVVNEVLVDTSDVLIGVFWARVGSKTKTERSGSIEEVRRFAKSGKPYGLFFKDAPLSMKHDREQLDALLEFKEEVHSFEGDLRGLTQDFRTDDELRRYISRYLTDTLRRLRNAEDDAISTFGGSVRTLLDQGLRQILSAATLLALKEDDPSTLVLLDRKTNPDLSHMGEGRFRELVDELLRQGLIEVKSDHGTGGLYLELTTEGLDQGLHAVTPNFDRAVSRIKTAVCAHSPATVDELSTGLELPALLVYHVARNFADEGLLRVDRYSDQIKISRPTTALCNWEAIRRRKACLVIGPRFPNKGDRDRQQFDVDLLNEGEHEAREIRAMWDLGDGFPPEELVEPLPYVVPAGTSGPESRYHIGFAVPWPDRDEYGEAIRDQVREVRLKLTFRDGLEERDEASFTLRLRNARDVTRWTLEELREKARLAPICQGSRMEAR